MILGMIAYLKIVSYNNSNLTHVYVDECAQNIADNPLEMYLQEHSFHKGYRTHNIQRNSLSKK